MHWIRLLVICLVGLLTVSCSRNSGKTPPAIVDGVIDVTKWDFEHDGPIALIGDWELDLEGSLETNVAQSSRDFIKISSFGLAKLTRRGRIIDEARWAKFTFHVDTGDRTLMLDFSGRPLAYAYFVRCQSATVMDEFSAGIETPSVPWKSSPVAGSGSVALHGSSQCSILVEKADGDFHLSNAARLLSPHETGLWSIGVTLVSTAVVSSVCFLFAMLLVALDRKDPVPRWSALYLAAWTTRLWLCTKSSYLPGSVIQASGTWVWFRIEYLSLWVALFAMVRYGEVIASQRIPGSRWVGLVALVFVAIAAFLPLGANRHALPIGQVAFIGFGGLMVAALYRRSNSSRSALAALIGFGVVLVGGLGFSIGMALGGKHQPSFEAMMTAEPLFQMVVLCIRTAEARRRSEKFAAATTQFVPQEFLHFLGHEDVTTAKLGDAISRKVTVLFADIRNFTTLSEKMSPEETFRFLNACLSRIGPHIRANRGFVDKYIGDAIMALFPESPADAVRAALAMQREVQAYNAKTQGKTPLAIGLGIHVGQVMMGTIGEEQRFEATVISDAVNLTARIETLTKQLGCSILVSADVAQQLSAEDSRYVRTLGTFAVKGKSTPVELIEIFDSDGNELRTRKADSRTPFAKALEHYTRGDLVAAADIVSTLAAAAPDDGPMAWWHARLQKESTMASKASSFGVVRLDEK